MVRQSGASLGYTVLTATNGEEAIEVCEKKAPALAILDVIMPKLGGIAVAGKLKELYPALPVLFTSGYSENTSASNLPSALTEYLQKPYSPASLAQAIRRMLSPAPKSNL